MKRRMMAMLMLLVLTATAAFGQNKIDDMVEHFSTRGSATFTSVVDRDPKTGKIKSVVKVLTAHNMDADNFANAFEKASAEGTFSKKTDSDKTTLRLTTKGKNGTRVYMMTYNCRTRRDVMVTIIIKRS